MMMTIFNIAIIVCAILNVIFFLLWARDNRTKVKWLTVWYVPVGNLPPREVPIHMERFATHIKRNRLRGMKDIFLPIRPDKDGCCNPRVEIYNIGNAKNIPNGEDMVEELMKIGPQEPDQCVNNPSLN